MTIDCFYNLYFHERNHKVRKVLQSTLRASFVIPLIEFCEHDGNWKQKNIKIYVAINYLSAF